MAAFKFLVHAHLICFETFCNNQFAAAYQGHVSQILIEHRSDIVMPITGLDVI